MSVNKKTKYEYYWILNLMRSQKYMLKDKQEYLEELYNLCDNDSQKDLIRDLLIRFNCFDDDIYNLVLIEISKYIHSLGYPPNETALIALCHNSKPDSSESVLNDIKVSATRILGTDVKFFNRFDRLKKYHEKEGIRHFIGVDEFVGSGQTIMNCQNDFLRENFMDSTLDFCIVAGMEKAKLLCLDNGINLFVGYSMEKGISDYYSGAELLKHINDMEGLENKLAAIVNKTNLENYKFGYRQSEALFSRLHRNIPNNVFPIFWWKRYKDDTIREPLFDRVQDGY